MKKASKQNIMHAIGGGGGASNTPMPINTRLRMPGFAAAD